MKIRRLNIPQRDHRCIPSALKRISESRPTRSLRCDSSSERRQGSSRQFYSDYQQAVTTYNMLNGNSEELQQQVDLEDH